MAVNSLPKSEYVDAVLNLIELTQKGKLSWHPVILTGDRRDELGFGASQYEADFQGVTLRLIVGIRTSTTLSPPVSPRDALIMALSPPSHIKLQAIKPDGEVVVDFPLIPPLRGLRLAVMDAEDHEELAFLEAINAAASAAKESKRDN